MIQDFGSLVQGLNNFEHQNKLISQQREENLQQQIGHTFVWRTLAEKQVYVALYAFSSTVRTYDLNFESAIKIFIYFRRKISKVLTPKVEKRQGKSRYPPIFSLKSPGPIFFSSQPQKILTLEIKKCIPSDLVPSDFCQDCSPSRYFAHGC